MKIIGHRGAAGLATENTINSFKKAVEIGVDYIECDVRKTKDDQLVVNHDASLKRVFGINMIIGEHTLDELVAACPELPTLKQALAACNNTPLVIELKEVIEPELLKNELKGVGADRYQFASFIPEALTQVKRAFPETELYLLSFRHFYGRVKKATAIDASGIAMHYGLLNHFAVWRARRNNLNIYTYTINSPFIAKLYARIFPDLIICTDRPDKLQLLRSQ